MILNKILLRSIVVYSIVVFSCSGIHPGEPMKRLYPLIDDKAVIHKYRDNFDKLIFPRHNEKLTQYCGVHYEWEVIKAQWSRDKLAKPHNERWIYIVNKYTRR